MKEFMEDPEMKIVEFEEEDIFSNSENEFPVTPK